MISYEDFAKLDIRVGRVVSAERVPDTDKLLRLTVDVGEEQPRQIVSGIAHRVSDPDDLVGESFPFLVNLTPRTIRGLESRGMILVAGAGGALAFLKPDRDVPPGSSIQ